MHDTVQLCVTRSCPIPLFFLHFGFQLSGWGLLSPIPLSHTGYTFNALPSTHVKNTVFLNALEAAPPAPPGIGA